MTWGCKAENHPEGCGWAIELLWPREGLVEWWCDTCERAGHYAVPPTGQTEPGES